MGLKNCPTCGKLMLENPRGICPECYVQEEQDELKVVEYLREKKKSSVDEIHEATGVKIKTILRMIRESRILSDVSVTFPCESCGAPIIEGRICSTCSKNFTNQLGKLQQRDAERPGVHPHQPSMNYIRERK